MNLYASRTVANATTQLFPRDAYGAPQINTAVIKSPASGSNAVEAWGKIRHEGLLGSVLACTTNADPKVQNNLGTFEWPLWRLRTALLHNPVWVAVERSSSVHRLQLLISSAKILFSLKKSSL